MPHICTRCSNVFDLGEDILKGCPNCGGKKFMFVKKKPRNELAQLQQPEQIITRAMGVRIPPRRTEKESMAIEQEMQSSQKSAPAAASSPPFYSPAKKKLDDGKPEGKALESIKITAPGTYELNLPSLFEREELIMAVKEGTYFIDLTSAFKKGKKD
ncbi:MAG: Zn-ribbon domain-containing protein [Methanothrix sp.]|nr:Zn-ribbon domain-containing protein [Methanothrix sp.]